MAADDYDELKRDYDEFHSQPDDVNDDEYFERDDAPSPILPEDE